MPVGLEEWIEAAEQALVREGSLDWADARRLAEEVATRLWNDRVADVIPDPRALRPSAIVSEAAFVQGMLERSGRDG